MELLGPSRVLVLPLEMHNDEKAAAIAKFVGCPLDAPVLIPHPAPPPPFKVVAGH
jgi:hypothetical protein